jgi:cytidylate kinase
MSVITVSRQRGSMGSYIALEVARKLDLRYLDREIILSVAQEAGVEAEAVEAIEEKAGRLARFQHLLNLRPKLPTVASASLREQASFDERIRALMDQEHLSQEVAVSHLEGGAGLEYIPRLDYLDLVTSIILEQAANGQAMIVGRGGQMILRERPGMLHVQVLAKFETRVYNIIQREGVKWREAAHQVRLADEQRAGYMRRFYNVDWLDSALYDLVINTDHIPCDAATEIVVSAAQAVANASPEEG